MFDTVFVTLALLTGLAIFIHLLSSSLLIRRLRRLGRRTDEAKNFSGMELTPDPVEDAKFMLGLYTRSMTESCRAIGQHRLLLIVRIVFPLAFALMVCVCSRML